MATALATIEYMEQNSLPTNAATQGATLRERLEEFQAEFDFIGDVRGMGLMQGVEIIKPGTDKEPDAPGAGTRNFSAISSALLYSFSGRLLSNTRIPTT